MMLLLRWHRLNPLEVRNSPAVDELETHGLALSAVVEGSPRVVWLQKQRLSSTSLDDFGLQRVHESVEHLQQVVVLLDAIAALCALEAVEDLEDKLILRLIRQDSIKHVADGVQVVDCPLSLLGVRLVPKDVLPEWAVGLSARCGFHEMHGDGVD
jgi:hypothetical protein